MTAAVINISTETASLIGAGIVMTMVLVQKIDTALAQTLAQVITEVTATMSVEELVFRSTATSSCILHMSPN
jgi:hypothetical protein